MSLLSRMLARQAIEVPFDQVADLASIDSEMVRHQIEAIGQFAERRVAA